MMEKKCSIGFFCCGFIVLVLLFIISFTIFYLIFIPQDLKLTVTEASLTKFEYISAPNNTLYYSLALNLTIRNPNKKVGVYFRRVRILSNYRTKRFSMVTLNASTPFYQGHKNTTVLPAKIEGQQLLLLKEKDTKQFNSEMGLGLYTIDVKVALRVRTRYGKIKSIPFKPNLINCKLKIPLRSSNGTTLNGQIFKATKCSRAYILINRPRYSD